MSLPDDLLTTARRLAHLDPTRPRQASLRRAVSSAYYALFHLLTAEVAGLYAGDPALGGLIGRSLDHGEMKRVSESLLSSRLPRSLAPQSAAVFASPEFTRLKVVVTAFVELQNARHTADYNPSARLTRSDALRRVEQVERAFAAWAEVRRADVARLYLGCLLLWDRWDKPPR